MWMTILQCGSIKRAWEEHHEIQFKFIILSTCVQINIVILLGRRLFNVFRCYLTLSRCLLSEFSFNVNHELSSVAFTSSPLLQSSTKNSRCQTLWRVLLATKCSVETSPLLQSSYRDSAMCKFCFHFSL